MTRPSARAAARLPRPHGLGFSVQLAERMRGGIEPWAVLALGPSLHVLVESDAEPGYPARCHSPHFRPPSSDSAGRTTGSSSTRPASSDRATRTSSRRSSTDDRRRAEPQSRGTDLRAAMKQLGARKAVGVVLWEPRRAGRAPVRARLCAKEIHMSAALPGLGFRGSALAQGGLQIARDGARPKAASCSFAVLRPLRAAPRAGGAATSASRASAPGASATPRWRPLPRQRAGAAAPHVLLPGRGVRRRVRRAARRARRGGARRGRGAPASRRRHARRR